MTTYENFVHELFAALEDVNVNNISGDWTDPATGEKFTMTISKVA